MTDNSTPASAPAAWRQRIPRWVGFGLSLACICYVAAALVKDFESLPRIDWLSPAPVAALAAAVVIYSLTLVLGGYAWSLLLRREPDKDNLAILLWISLTTQLAKYLPGNVGHILGRLALARMKGIETLRLGISLVLETLLAIAAACVVALAGLLSHEPLTGVLLMARDAVLGAGYAPLLFAAALAIVAGLLLGLKFSARFSDFIQRARLQQQSPQTLASCLAIYIVNFLLVGVSAWLIAKGVLGNGEVGLLGLSGLFAIAWIPGFLTPGSPGGLGIREAVLLAGLTPLVGPGAALAIALLLRLVTTLGDVVGFAMGQAIHWRSARGLSA